MPTSIDEMLSFSTKHKASHIYLSVGMPFLMRVNGDVRRVNVPPFGHDDIHKLLLDVMTVKESPPQSPPNHPSSLLGMDLDEKSEQTTLSREDESEETELGELFKELFEQTTLSEDEQSEQTVLSKDEQPKQTLSLHDIKILEQLEEYKKSGTADFIYDLPGLTKCHFKVSQSCKGINIVIRILVVAQRLVI
ncbi:hypothetical protein TI05_02955 [Achromatium sp. WMS3]|nr:hypothetical protein TI05_02955 [Achromatium sp. WMS3]